MRGINVGFIYFYYYYYSEEFDATNNTVELHLHLAPFYKTVNGVLQPVSEEPSGSINLSFDRRKTIGDLRITIYHVF